MADPKKEELIKKCFQVDEFDFKNIIINSENEITEKDDAEFANFRKEAIIYCLLVNKKITINRKNYGLALQRKWELSPYDIFSKIDL